MSHICYDCKQPKPTREQLKAGVRRHVCVPMAEPEAGTRFVLETFEADPSGLLGSYGCDILDSSGAVIAGCMSTREYCERLLRIRGFRGPFQWPTVEASKAERAARRASRSIRAAQRKEQSK
jgi:hypothetical protein